MIISVWEGVYTPNVSLLQVSGDGIDGKGQQACCSVWIKAEITLEITLAQNTQSWVDEQSAVKELAALVLDVLRYESKQYFHMFFRSIAKYYSFVGFSIPLNGNYFLAYLS